MAREIIVAPSRRKYHWPEAQLNLWILTMLIASGLTLGVFAFFMTVQTQMGLGIPWLFPFEVTTSALSLGFLLLILFLISQRLLLPGVVIIGSFILFVLWLTGVVQTAVQMFGPSGGTNNLCNTYVTGQTFSGVNVATLAWLEQKNICNCWDAAFAFEVVGTIFLLWMMIMAYQVNQDEYD